MKKFFFLLFLYRNIFQLIQFIQLYLEGYWEPIV